MNACPPNKSNMVAVRLNTPELALFLESFTNDKFVVSKQM